MVEKFFVNLETGFKIASMFDEGPLKPIVVLQVKVSCAYQLQQSPEQRSELRKALTSGCKVTITHHRRDTLTDFLSTQK